MGFRSSCSSATLVLLGLTATSAFTPSLVGTSGVLSYSKAPSCSRSALATNLQMASEGPGFSAQKAAVVGVALIGSLFPSDALAQYQPEALSQLPGMTLAVTRNLPEGWEAAASADGREYYYNTITKKSQWELPEGADTEEVKFRKKRASDLNKFEAFDAPAVPIDKLTVKEAIAPKGECGTSDFRANSIECGEPAKGPIADIASKSGSTLQTLSDQNKMMQKVQASDARNRMLQAAEQKSLENSDLYKKLYAKTIDPERAAQRKKELDEITKENDAGAMKAPWDKPDDYVPPELPKLPELKVPELKVPSLPKLF